MPISLPLDVIDSILSYLCGTASIAECALVCRSWLPSARYHLLPPPKALHLDQVKIARFLRLIDSPGSTLSFVTFNTLDLRQNTVTDAWNDPPSGDEWRSEVAIRDFLARHLISFRSVTSLSLGWVDWQTLTPAAVTSLHSNFTSVKELKLEQIPFTLSDFCMLLAPLTALEKITIDNGVPFDSTLWTIDTVQISPPSLCHVAFSDHIPSWMIRFFARAIQYPSGITSVSIILYRVSEQLQACGELLKTAGTNLRTFRLQTWRIDGPPPGTDSSYSALLAFPHNTNLQEIDIEPVDESTIMLLLQGLRTNAKPNLSRLRLGLYDEHWLNKWTGGRLMDEVLSAMVAKTPKLIIDLVVTLHNAWDYETNTREALEAAEKAYLEKSFEWWKNILPRAAQCWTLEVQYDGSCICSRPDEVLRSVQYSRF